MGILDATRRFGPVILCTRINVGRDNQCSDSLYSSRPQHTQRRKQDPQIQHEEHTTTLDGENLDEVESFIYLDSNTDERAGSHADVKTTIGKAKTAFPQLKNIWNSKQLSPNIKVKIPNTSVKTILVNELETWRTTTTIIERYRYL
ncbi:unnamed protein product [Schistosoma margrebowiei]|uniref:Uncharacterized protein n=1 Tax=Schistosoma margrebowiei TaxID=48269 RepID=A0A183LI28_9TREM|nr:unnamed protein product [Schistosoma margrebowiei]